MKSPRTPPAKTFIISGCDFFHLLLHTNICYEGGEGEGELLLGQSDAAAAEHDLHLQGVPAHLNKDWIVSHLNNQVEN